MYYKKQYKSVIGSKICEQNGNPVLGCWATGLAH